MAQKDLNKFLASIKKGKTEEDIKNAYAKYFDIDYDTADKHDLYTPRVLFEFKFDKNFQSIKTRSQIIAQTLYYIRRLKFKGFIEKPIPPILCLADQNEAILTETSIWKSFYDDPTEKYDWDLAPSQPDKNLVNDIANAQITLDTHIFDISTEIEFVMFAEKLTKYLNNQIFIDFEDKKVITEDNFEDIFVYWNKIFGDSVRNGTAASRYFVSDIQKDNTIFLKEQSKAIFRIGQTGEMKEKKILAKDYEHFWSLYEKTTNVDTLRAIFSKIDRLTDETMRKFHGVFFTPIRFAKKALDYIEKTISKNWWQTGEYRLWDMAAGTGNLEYHLPQEALKYCYLSTLYPEDKEHLDKLFVGANIFQYDYLNDDIENVFSTTINFGNTWKLPEKIRTDLQNPKIKWIILINPPFATAQQAGTNNSDSKEGVADTKLRKVMHTDNLGEVSRELAMQFIYRLKAEFKERIAHLGLFYKIKHLNSNNDQKLRDTIFKFQYENGFVFSSANFDGTSRASAFPIAFMLWNLSIEKPLEAQTIELDIFNENVEKIGTKIVTTEEKESHLSKWIKRPTANIKFPPFGSAIEVKSKNADRRDRTSIGFLASLMCKGNDFQNQNFTAFLSGPYVSAGALSVTAENFEQAMVVHAARRLPKATWLNDRDQFMQPKTELSAEFISDCTVWSLFSNSNATASLKNVVYEKETYQVRNHFFPFLVSEVRNWRITDTDISITLAGAEDTFVSKWLLERELGGFLSAEAKAVLEKGKEIYQFYFAHLNVLRTNKFKIEHWDTGWWQIKQVLQDENLQTAELKALKALHDQLKEKLLPQLQKSGIIQ
jgi:hypothetical protein